MKEYLKEFVGKKVNISYYYKQEDCDNYYSANGKIVDVIGEQIIFKNKDGLTIIPLRIMEHISIEK